MAKKFTVEQVSTDLKIDEDLKLHEKGWKVQRIGRILILLLVVLTAGKRY